MNGYNWFPLPEHPTAAQLDAKHPTRLSYMAYEHSREPVPPHVLEQMMAILCKPEKAYASVPRQETSRRLRAVDDLCCNILDEVNLALDSAQTENAEDFKATMNYVKELISTVKKLQEIRRNHER